MVAKTIGVWKDSLKELVAHVRRSIRRPWVLLDFQTLLFWKSNMIRGCSCSPCRSRGSGRSWDSSIRGNSLPVPSPPGGPFLKRITIWDPEGLPATYPFGHQHFSRQRSRIVAHKNTRSKKENNAQSVTFVHKLSLSRMSIIKNFSEPISTQTCGPCDGCRLPNSLRARSGHDATNRRHQFHDHSSVQ